MLKRVMKFMGFVTPTLPSSEPLIESAQWCISPCTDSIHGRPLLAPRVESGYETVVEVLCKDGEWRDLPHFLDILWCPMGYYEVTSDFPLNIRIKCEDNWDYICLYEGLALRHSPWAHTTIIGGVEQPRPH